MNGASRALHQHRQFTCRGAILSVPPGGVFGRATPLEFWKGPMKRLMAMALIWVAAACQGEGTPAADSDAAASTQTAAARDAESDLADVTEYELSMDKVDKYFAAQRNMMAKVKDMTQAERDALDMGNSANASLDDMARSMDRNPAIRSAIEDAGLSSREYATLTMAFVQAAMASSVLQMRPNENQDSLAREMKASMDNIRFMREHEAELTRKQQELAAEMKRMGVTNE